MSRRSTPERLDAAWHAGVRSALIGEGATPETADAWMAAWEGQARLAADGGVAEPTSSTSPGPFGYQTPPT